MSSPASRLHYACSRSSAAEEATPDTLIHAPKISARPGYASDAINLENIIRSPDAVSVRTHRLQQACRRALYSEGHTEEEVKGHSFQTWEWWARGRELTHRRGLNTVGTEPTSQTGDGSGVQLQGLWGPVGKGSLERPRCEQIFQCKELGKSLSVGIHQRKGWLQLY